MNIGILDFNNFKNNIINNLPNNTYLIYNLKGKENKQDYIKDAISFLESNNCIYFVVYSEKEYNYIINNSKRNIITLMEIDKIPFNSKNKKVIMCNYHYKKISKNFINYNTVGKYRKDAKPKDTILKIKTILKENDFKVKEKEIRRNLNGIYSIRLEFNNNKGSNGKGISLNLAKASAYAELMERLQSNMLFKKRISTNALDKNNKYYDSLLKNVSSNYKNKFFELDDIYFNTEKMQNIKTQKDDFLPINAINCFCHTNGLASGNSFPEAVSQAIFEILERYCYQVLLYNNIPIKNIDLDTYLINDDNKKILNKFKKLGYHYYIKDCSLGKYPVLGLLLLNKEKSKYTFTIASDYSFDIALSRCITEMLQGVNLRELNNKMVKIESLDKLHSKYKNNFLSYNWLRCFTNNNGFLSNNFFETEYIDIKNLKFKNYLTNNNEILEELKKDIKEDIFIKDYNTLGFDTYRVYIPNMTCVDCFDIEDLEINKNYNNLKSTYTNILNTNSKNLNFFINTFIKASESIKYDSMIKPSDLFHTNELTDYYKLDFTSLLIVLCLLTHKQKELTNLLKFKIDNFPLTDIKILTYKILINLLNNKTEYNVNNKELESSLKYIISNPRDYLKSLDTIYKEKNISVINKKSLN